MLIGSIPSLEVDVQYVPLPVRTLLDERLLGEWWFFGLLRSHEAAGGLWVTIVLIALALLFWDAGVAMRRLLALIFVVNLWALIFTKARTFWLAYLIGAAVLAILYRRRHAVGRTVVMGFALLITTVASFVLVPGAIGRLRFDPEAFSVQTASDRVIYWTAAAEMIRSRPWIGVGLGRYPQEFAEKPRPLLYVSPDPEMVHAHSSYLHLFAELGVFGLLLFLAFWTLLLVDVSQQLRRLPVGSLELAVATGVLAAILAQLIAAFFDHNLWSPTVTIPITILAGFVGPPTSSSPEPS